MSHMQKICSEMEKRDSSYMLKGMVEYDEAYVKKGLMPSSSSNSSAVKEARDML